MFKPCIIIPVYNHGILLEKCIGRILEYNIPVIIVNDGSDKETYNILENIKSKNNNITLIHHEINGGKGKAVVSGMKEAYKNGYSHSLQIDADGQHDASDIKLFFEQAEKFPDAVINGQPVYDSSAPKARAYGRNITNFWVMIETLSRDIKDAMCGFRVYPLKAVMELLKKRLELSSRMGFDIDIIVRLHWLGIKIINQKTKVIYPEDGLSNFKMLKDNVRISALHTRLVCEMMLKKLFFYIN